ncbi:MAG TPA: proton-conducting transporter membrane subunit [Clostridiaceae bacterium]
MNNLILLLIVVPLIFAILFTLSNNKTFYKIISYALCLFGTTVSIMLAYHGTGNIKISGTAFSIVEGIIIICELLIILFLFYVSIKNKRWGVLTLTAISTVLSVYTTFFIGKSETSIINVDSLSIVMALIVNIVGTLIVVFANGYMTEYEHHRGMKSKQKLFYAVICVFLAAMNGLIFSDSLSWMYFFWEITTLASFILIAYNADAEALNSGFRALFINIIGGISFIGGIIIFKTSMNIDSFSGILAHGRVSSFAIIPVFLLCIAGFAKSAQVPFQSWLLGAMVAPTPVSALLHSSTMVKAGVFLIIKLSPAFAGTSLGTAIAVYGAFTFVLCSAMAVSQSNAKRVLAYSTIANLGLIICSAGIGTGVAIAAAITLLIFHAVSKALLFLCTGQIEHTIGSRDIEDMFGLIHKAPALTLITAFGIISMILPPFGVLVTKWISIEASATNPLVVIFLVLGSALTTIYYIKWLGTMLSFPSVNLKPEKTIKRPFSVYLVLSILSVIVLAISIFITPIYNNLVAPEIKSLAIKSKDSLSAVFGDVSSKSGTFNNSLVFIALGILIVLSLIVWKVLVSKTQVKSIYMCGENNSPDNDKNMFRSGNDSLVESNISNYYLKDIFNEKALSTLGYVVSISIILVVLIGGLL